MQLRLPMHPLPHVAGQLTALPEFRRSGAECPGHSSSEALAPENLRAIKEARR
jgi:hypothetical protein